MVGWDQWQALKNYVGPWDNHTHELGHWFHPQYPLASRLVSSIHGYMPIGFFQLFHGSATVQNNAHLRRYPTEHGDAARTDYQFAIQWDRRYRVLIPEVIVLHLESARNSDGTGWRGANWEGRTTPRFGPGPGPKPEHHHKHHHHDHHHHKYS